MCKYINRYGVNRNNPCINSKIFDDFKTLNLSDLHDNVNSLPIDEDGYCIFHSINIDWKKENNFNQRFLDLLTILNHQANIRKNNKEKRGTFNFEAFVFVGNNNIIDFSELEFIENTYFKNAVFNEKLLLNNTTLKNGCQFDNTKFNNNVEINNTNFNDTATFQYSEFEGDFTCQNSIFEGAVLFSSAIFKNKFAIKKCNFDDFVMFDEISFNNKTAWALFDDLVFNKFATVDFSNSKFEGLVRFKEIIFNADVSFINCFFSLLKSTNPRSCAVSFEKLSIGINAIVQYKGYDPYFRMFANDVFFSFDEDVFGKIFFKNVDLSSLHYSSLKYFDTLKKQKKLIIKNGCVRDRVNNINIFIASQDILNSEREFIENKILRKNLSFVPKDILMTPIRWEKFDKSNDGTRKQDGYLDLISDSEIFILILWNSIGKYTKEEFDYACLEMGKGKNPKYIYIFNKINNKDFDDINREDNFPAFLDKLVKEERLIINFSDNLSISDELEQMFYKIEERYNK